LEGYATQFDPLLASVAQRRGFRDYLQGLLLPRDRNKTLTGLAGAEPITGAQHREVQRLQWFLSESAWDHEVVNDRRVQQLVPADQPAPTGRPPRPAGQPGRGGAPVWAAQLGGDVSTTVHSYTRTGCMILAPVGGW
jgi:hypothetical protein